MKPIYYGHIIYKEKYKNNIYIITENNLIYTLFIYNKDLDVTDIVKRVSEVEYLEQLIKEHKKVNERVHY